MDAGQTSDSGLRQGLFRLDTCRLRGDPSRQFWVGAQDVIGPGFRVLSYGDVCMREKIMPGFGGWWCQELIIDAEFWIEGCCVGSLSRAGNSSCIRYWAAYMPGDFLLAC